MGTLKEKRPRCRECGRVLYWKEFAAGEATFVQDRGGCLDDTPWEEYKHIGGCPKGVLKSDA